MNEPGIQPQASVWPKAWYSLSDLLRYTDFRGNRIAVKGLALLPCLEAMLPELPE